MKSLILGLVLLLPLSIWAGNDPQPLGARRIGLGYAYTGVSGDLWCISVNPAGLAGLEKKQAGIYYERRYLLSEINSGAMAYGMSFAEKHFVAADFSGFGFGGYNESKLGLTYATNIIPKLSIGGKFNLVHTTIQEYGSLTRFVLDAGLHSQVTKTLALGFSVNNASQTYMRKSLREKVPTTLNLGLSWKVSEKVLAVADLSKQENFPASFRAGVEYHPVEILYVRGGIMTQPVVFNFGAGVVWKNFQLDFANSIHEKLGYTPHLSLGAKF